MSEVFIIDPNDVPLAEYPEWETILESITDKEVPWVEYAAQNNFTIIVFNLFGRYTVHVTEREAYRVEVKVPRVDVKTLADLKVMALKLMVTS